MKKNLLIALAVTLAISVTAQNKVKKPNFRSFNKVSAPVKIYAEPSQNQLSAPSKTTPAYQRAAVRVSNPLVTTIPIGNNPNAFSCANNGRSNIGYDQDAQTVVFIHRGASDPTVGYYRYDMSTDNGNTWSADLGPIYTDPGTVGARYPVCGIYNPTHGSPTVGTDAYISYYGPWTAGSGWGGSVTGGSKLDATGILQHATADPFMTFPENMTIVRNTQQAWKIGSWCISDASPTYNDSVNISHGVWNSGTNEYDFSDYHMPVPVNIDNHVIVDQDIAFSDDGQTGYIAMIVNNDPNLTVWHDSTFYIQVYKTIDGGVNWGSPCQIDFRTALDSLLAQDSTAEYSAAFDLDIVVDMNGHLHILAGIAPGAGFSIFTGAGIWGMFDIYNNSLDEWHAQLLDIPLTFRGVFGDGGTTNPTLNEDSRPFASRSWDGSKLFFSWFDTDTLTFPAASGNLFPDLHSIGYDVNTGLWTSAVNLTAGTAADGSCTFGNGAYYAIDQGGGIFSIPTVFMTLDDPTHTGLPCTFTYVNGANVDMSTATNAGNPVLLTCADFLTTVNPVSSPKSFNVSANYPNPFTGKTSVDISLTKAADVTIEVSNLLGQVMSVSKYTNLNTGAHTLTINGSKLASGVYTYKVTVDNETVTNKMIVQ